MANLDLLKNENKDHQKGKVKAKFSKDNRLPKSTLKKPAKSSFTTTSTTTHNTLKKRSRSKGELIFQSESQDSSTDKAKVKKGTPREIVIDGNNVAMA